MKFTLEHPQTFLFMGRSGCGKGTQVALLEKYLREIDPGRENFHIYPGTRFREFVHDEGYSNKLSKEVYEAGELQPEFLSVWMWSTDLITKLKDNEHLIFDGTPRKAHEALILHKALHDFYKRENPFLIVINISREVGVERLKARKREDDIDLEDIERRMDWFDSEVVPTIDFFKKDPYYRTIELDGEKSIEDIHTDLTQKLQLAWQS